jgi:3-deoxy-D-manno-octulosonic acid kinase
MTQNMKLACVQEDNIYCVFNENEITNFSTEMLSAAYWQAQSAVTGSAQGRGTTWFVKYNDKNNAGDKHWVLRHYYRGGLIGKIIKDSYFFISQKRTRAAREFSLLKYMQKLSLPAPQPIAYRVTRHGLFYRADLLSSRIENAQDLVAMLTEKSLSDDLWFAIGKTIKQFHDQGIYHHDLNAHNILINDNNKVWLIDFDQGEQRIVDQRWQQSNMQRLLRSFHKEHKNLTTFHWLECHWEKLIEGYNQ